MREPSRELCNPRYVDELSRGRVLVVGDVMMDTYLIGDAVRISPEAPVPVVRVEEIRHRLGGAGNVARNMTALNGRAVLVGLIGEDEDGHRLKSMLSEAGVEPCLVCGKRPTTVKSRVMARNQQMLRLDRECLAPATPEEYAALLKELEARVPDFDVVVVSDYGKGLISSGLLDDIRRMGCSGGRGAPKILVDPKPQNLSCYHRAWMLTPNTKETSESTGLPVRTRPEILAAGRHLREKLDAAHVLTTLGAEGMALFSAEGPVWHVPTMARQVFDVTGAGDTVIALIALALAVGVPLLDACVLANYAAGIVVGKVGAATASAEELRCAMREYPVTMERWD
ncbi:MAG: D-glycero-beta-D-manno-heptose-7-phosphate kinase [Desulfovibrionaceae bacterium]|nr:D-glycero-beta-D-manno-heptose-7-phosphate kinase [Desulfovibrionaceae bacterium]